MPAISKTGPSLFLGIELATDQLRASIVDESLELVGVECVDFDSELSEYKTQGGIFTTPGDAYTTPIEMWLKALDTLFEKLHRNYDLSRIKAIGGGAQHALVWWKSTTVPSLSSLDPHTPLHKHFPAQTFSLPNTPVAQDTSSQAHAVLIEELLGGPERMAARVGICANPAMVAAQLLRVRETWHQEVWARTGRVQLASAFMSSLLTGKWAAMGESEACATGIWVHRGNASAGPGQNFWDETVLDIVGGSREEGRRVRGWLGDVDVSGGARRVGHVSRYLVERYGFDPETIVAPFTSDYLCTYLSMFPSNNDAVLSFGPMDTLLTPAQHYMPTYLYNLLPHPAQDANEKRKYVAMLSSRNADVPRALVRDMYTKSWSAFDRLVAIVPPGGSIGLDDKLFSFWHLAGDSYPFSRVKGIFRFETGIKVSEFRDLRANPRCLVESQLLSFRLKWARLHATGVLGSRKTGVSPTPPPLATKPPAAISNLGLSFDPYDVAPLPSRVLATGAAANFPSISNLVGDVFNAPVFVPLTQIDSAQIFPHRNSPATGYPSRPSLGGAYYARWVWGKEWGSGGLSSYEDEMKRLLTKRWIGTGGQLLRSNVNGTTSTSNVSGTGSGANSGTSTPFGHPSSRSALGNTIFVEEDEDDDQDLNGRSLVALSGARLSPGVIGGGMYGSGGYEGRMRTNTGSTIDTLTSSSSSLALGGSTAYTTPDLGLPMGNLGSSGPLGGSGLTQPTTPTNGTSGASAPTPLTPIVALTTGDVEAQIGLGKVAEPDLDAFMTYAAIVAEYHRLEGMLVKGIV